MDYYAGLNGSYQSQFANLNAGYAYSDQNSSLNYAVSGAVVASKYGVVLSQPLQGTHALVLTEDSPGIEVINNASAKTNKSGLTVVSGLSPYRKNNLALNTQTIPDDAEIEESILNNIIPTKGALVLADFKSNKGYKLLINLKTPHIQIPMGAIANMENGTTAIVSNFNQLYIISKTHRGLINVQWRSNRQDQSCDVNFDATQIKAINGLYIMDVECRSPVAISAGL
ncbi:pili synthesis usher PapC-like protein [Acinetobacter calcoaceticus]|uniref:Pili synthesis usher PapC-like protein n=1 Tax=Acinetobacter calcoaceticus TaxID=471 RepID=A0A4R1XSV1_ACICA|nr:pili synthesis usher PapC-like protein [Acinetobacter calcoaceticus]